MRTLRIVLPFLALAASAGCSSRVAARPGVGVGVEHRADGGRLGLDFGEVSVDGAAVEPLTGNCPGGVCKIPSGLPPLTVETKVPVAAMVAAGVFMLLCIGGVAYVVARKAK